MDSVRIKQLKACYRLPASQLDARQRLDALLRAVTGDALEAALDYVGIGAHEEICIRQLHAPVRLRLSQSDQALIEQWSLALADTIRDTLEQGGSSVVRYPSRLNGYLDLAAGVALRCLNRSWAWNQLGLTALGEEPSQRQALQQLLLALEYEPQFIVPVFTQLARQQQLPALAQQLNEEAWQRLAQAALQVVGGGWQIGEVERALSGEAVAKHQDRASRFADGQGSREWAAAIELARSLLQRSTLARALLRTPRAFAKPALALESVAALIIVETEPTLARREAAWRERLVCALATQLQSQSPQLSGLEPFVAAAGKLAAMVDASCDVTLEGHAKTAANLSDSSSAEINQTRSDETGTDADSVENLEPPLVVMEETISPDAVSLPPGGREWEILEPRTEPVDTPVSPREEVDTYPVPLPGVQRQSEYGGLLYLLGLIDALALPDAIITADCFAERPFGWVLHQLGSSLLPLSQTDPALMAFCGLGDAEELPWREAPPCNEAECQWFDEAMEALLQSLRQRIGDELESRQALLQRVCHRYAQIHSEPGWLEVVFALDTVSTEIRRAALDLDPGYLPWLGQVVRFRYE